MLIALGVSGGIAAYKSCEVVRGLDQGGAAVQVLLTRNAHQFVTPLTLQTLSRRRVLAGTFDLSVEDTIQHIELTREIDALVVAPATANVLAKFARGVADDLLSTFFVAVTAPVIVAPAMNTRMWLNDSTRANLDLLRRRGVTVLEPDSGWLAEGESGPGRMVAPELIVSEALRAAARSRSLAGKKILITAGPTREPIDPVRYLSNRSSGKMGYALAAACARRGGEVVLVSGPVSRPTPFGVQRFDVETAEEMRAAVMTHRTNAHAIFMAAAVSDFIPAAQAAKIKKSGENLQLELTPGHDILAELGQERGDELLIGFAAETDSLLEHAQDKLARKKLDWIVANDVSRAGIGFDADDNEVILLGRDGSRVDVPRGSKIEVAETIVRQLFDG